MYLAEKPMVDNPFLIGEWPWYIVGLELVLIFTSLLFTFHLHLKSVFTRKK